jgi:hypothetical protein
MSWPRRTLIVAVSTLIVTSAGPTLAATDKPVNISGGATPGYAADSSGGGSTEFAAGGVTLSAGSASFDGTSGLLASAGPVLNTAQSYSVSAWVNLASNAPGDAVSQGGTNIGSFSLQYSSGFGGWSFTSASADSTTHTWNSAHLSTAPATGVWTHLVGVFNSSTGAMSLYVNGALAATGTNSTPWSGSGPLTIGGDQQAGGTKSGFFKGQVADVQVYQRALSSSDVSTLYSGGRSGGALGSSSHTTTWTVDERGLPTSMTDPNGNTTIREQYPGRETRRLGQDRYSGNDRLLHFASSLRRVHPPLASQTRHPGQPFLN